VLVIGFSYILSLLSIHFISPPSEQGE